LEVKRRKKLAVQRGLGWGEGTERERGEERRGGKEEEEQVLKLTMGG
jgi:hypothetical protein